MNEIRPWLYVGKYRDTLDPDTLGRHRIEAMLQLAEAVKQLGITSLYLSVEDGEPLPFHLLRQGIDFVFSERRQAHTVLIACGAGQSRSVAFAIAVLKEIEDLPLLSAWQEVKRHHPDALPHMALWESLCNYYRENIPYLTNIRPVLTLPARKEELWPLLLKRHSNIIVAGDPARSRSYPPSRC